VKIVIIEWFDACSYETRHELDHEYSLKRNISIGFLISDVEKQIVISRGIEVDDKLTEGVLVIPKGWVNSICVIEGSELRVKPSWMENL
jgi:hypothetical protein